MTCAACASCQRCGDTVTGTGRGTPRPAGTSGGVAGGIRTAGRLMLAAAAGTGAAGSAAYAAPETISANDAHARASGPRLALPPLPSVLRLLSGRCPPKVSRLVIAVVVPPVDSASVWAGSQLSFDVCDESGCIMPLIADFHSPAAIPAVVRSRRVVAAVHGCCPVAEQRVPRQAAPAGCSPVPLGSLLALDASARPHATAGQVR